ncbi:MAG: TetR/AcrR family transcriptional regulator, partial [Clostridia bacterium]
YRYFTNKEALYFAVINPFIENIRIAIEKEFILTGKTMKEISEAVVSFLINNSDELLIIRKGNTSHYETFINYIVEVISKKVKELLANSFPEIDEKITNPDFYNAIANGFLTSLFKILNNKDIREVQERKCRELITFYFGHLKDRFYHFDLN